MVIEGDDNNGKQEIEGEDEEQFLVNRWPDFHAGSLIHLLLLSDAQCKHKMIAPHSKIILRGYPIFVFSCPVPPKDAKYMQ